MTVADVMSRFVHRLQSTATIGDAAQIMGLFDVGMLPVEDAQGELVGIVTDRDLVIRGLADGLHPGTAISRVMTTDLCSCREGDDLAAVLRRMGEAQVRRMVVLSRQQRLVGIVSLADCARRDVPADQTSATLREICRPDGDRSQRLRVA